MPSTGVVEILALMALEKPQTLPGKPKTVILDAGIFWKPGASPIIATLRYYNESGGLFHVLAKVVPVKTNKTSNASKIKFASPIEYLLMGDIIHLISLPTLGPDMVYDPHTSALFRASGPVDSVDPSVFAFTMNLIQWTSYASHDSKWKSNRVNALPKLQRVVTLTGTMPVLPNSAESKGDEFCITVTRDLEYVGWTSPNPPGPAPPKPALSHSHVASDIGEEGNVESARDELKCSARPIVLHITAPDDLADILPLRALMPYFIHSSDKPTTMRCSHRYSRVPNAGQKSQTTSQTRTFLETTMTSPLWFSTHARYCIQRHEQHRTTIYKLGISRRRAQPSN
ncbi:hypothetical protein BGW80DRAFT_1253080 [Lactifluus volemus]|nr:hypothetical protein BGW80DRAFT_1253080 [Lactifluus volemus]